MKRVIRWMSKRPWTWRAWMAAGTPFIVTTFAVALAWEAYRAVRAEWNFSFRQQWRDWFDYFGEEHRLSLHSLGLKPAPGESIPDLRSAYLEETNAELARVADQVWLFEDKGFGREFTPVSHVRQAEDVQ